MSIVELLDQLIDVIEKLNALIDRPASLREDKKFTISDLLKISLSIIENLDDCFGNVVNYDIDEVNKKIDYLVKQLSIFFALEENRKNNLNDVELHLYNDLVHNLHILSEKSFQIENDCHLGLHTFDKISAETGFKLLKEGFQYFLEIIQN